jgi:tetratricopeptide (TPR) repeat protein
LKISAQFQKEIDAQKKYYWAQLFNQGVVFFQKGSNSKDKDSTTIFYDKSINAFKSCVIIEPDSADTFKNLAFVYMTQQKYDDAIEPLKVLIKKENSLDGYKYLGSIYYDKATKLKEKYENSHDAQDSIQANEWYNKTIELMQQGRKYYENDSELLVLLSNSYIGAQKIDVAIDAFKVGVDKEPSNKYYRYNYGVLLLGRKNYAEAEEQFRKAIVIDSTYQNAIYNLAVTYVRWGADLAKANEGKDNPGTEYKEKYQLALPYLEKSVKLNPNDSSMWELLGRVYTALGNQDKAKDAFDRADQLHK